MVKRALVEIGVRLEGIAVSHCPVDSGRLKGSLTYATQREKDNTRSPARSGDGVSKPNDKYTLYVGTNVAYSQHVEYGTKRMAAQPYLRPALDEGRKQASDLFKMEIKAQLRGK